MKLIIAGSRTWYDDNAIESTVAGMLHAVADTLDEIVSGCCPTGADAIGEEIARRMGIPVKRFPADWKTHGNAAGPIRNRAMAEYADACVVFQIGDSRGSASMIAEAKRAGIDIVVFHRGLR